MITATQRHDGKLGWALAFGAILLLSIPLDQWSGVPMWLASLWGFLAKNQAIFAILLAAAVLLRVFVFERTVRTESIGPENPLELDRADHRLLSFAHQVPLDIPLFRWIGWGLAGVGVLLGFRWLRGLMTLDTVSEFRVIVGEMFWVVLLVAAVGLSLRLLVLVRKLHARITELLADAHEEATERKRTKTPVSTY